MDWLKKPIFTYIGMILATLAVIAGVVRPDWSGVLWTVAGFLGFGSISLLRTFIDSKGWKTHAVFVVTALAAFAQMLGWITPEVYQEILLAFTPVIGVTIQQALAKSNTSSVPTVK
jgi:hypothetical protein